MNRINFLGINIDNCTKNELIHSIEQQIKNHAISQIVGVNIDQVLRVNQNQYSRKIFDESTIVFTDGKPIIWMSKLLGSPIIERTTGPDLMNDLCALAALKGYRIFLLGAGPGVAFKAVKKLTNKYNGLVITGTYSPPFGFEKDKDELNKINMMLKSSNSDMLFVGLGSPKQDIFIYENKDVYQIPVSFSMGAAIDFIAGNIKRAPRWMINCGLEWFYRVLRDPKRLWKRYFIDDLKIIPLFLKYYFFK